MNPDIAMPNVWGPGQLLAFSGVDGQTQAGGSLVMNAGPVPGSFLINSPVAATLELKGAPHLSIGMLLGDVVEATSPAGPFRLAFRDATTVFGALPERSRLLLNGRAVTEFAEIFDETEDWVLSACCRGDRWFLALRPELPEETEVDELLAADFRSAAAARAAFVAEIRAPEGMSEADERLLRKAASVMKVNTCSPEGRIPCRWTTPDRWPHRNMWLWDSAFHAIGMSAINPPLAAEAVGAMLHQVRRDGMLPHRIDPNGPSSEITQPPLLAWAALTVYGKTGDREWAKDCIHPLKRYLDWDLQHRDHNENGLPEWHVEGDPLCRCGESGLDNSSVYDSGRVLDSPDFAAYLCHDYRCLAAIAEALGQIAPAHEATAAATRIAAAVEENLWNERLGIYCHRDTDGEPVPIRTVAGFMPLFAGIASPERARRLAQHLQDPTTFGTAFPIPSESVDSGTFCKDMWRGPAWINMNYLVILGLRKYGLEQEAEALKAKTLNGVRETYETTGCLWEFYDSLGLTPPANLDRKQRLRLGRGYAPIADYHWTAALTAALLLEA